MTAPIYRIRNWSVHFETHESRRTKVMSWFALPNKHDGKSYRRLTRHPRATEVFAAWVLILQVASKAPTRGTLAGLDGPMTALDLADATGFPEAIFELAFEVLTDPKIAWLEREGVEVRNPGHSEKPAGQMAESAGHAPGKTGILPGTPGASCEMPAYRQDKTDRTGQTGAPPARRPDIDLEGIADPKPTTTPQTNPGAVSDDEAFRIASRWVACHSKDPDRKAELRQTVIDLYRRHGKRWLEVSEALRWKLNEKPWPEQVEVELATVLAAEAQATPNPDDEIIRQARALVAKHGALAWQTALGVSRTPPFSQDELIALLPENLPMCDRIIAMGKPGTGAP